MPYRGPAMRPLAPRTASGRQPYPGLAHARMPYTGNHRDHDRDRRRDRFAVYGLNGWPGYPYSPWGWGDPYLYDNWDNGEDYDSQPASNYAASQDPGNMPGPYEPGPYDQASGDEPEPPAYTPWPYSRPAPTTAPAPSAFAPDATVTLVFKDGRPNEQIHNYLLTASTLSVLDQHRQVIPVDQIDVAATAQANRDAGVEFALPK